MMAEKFLVINLDDVQKALVSEDIAIFAEHQKLIQSSRNARGLVSSPSYIVCDSNEPYAQLVAETIRHGEAVQHAHKMMARLAKQMNRMSEEARRDEVPGELDLGETNDPD